MLRFGGTLALLAALFALLAGTRGAGAAFHLRSSSFPSGSTVPRLYLCRSMGGENRSPELQWSAPPPGTKSLALILHDPDAPAPGGWWHWGIYNIPPTVRRIGSGARVPGDLAFGSSHRRGYNGPCPPPGKLHHYHFTLYALDAAHLGHGTPLTAEALERLAKRHAIAVARYTGLFMAPGSAAP